MNVDINRMKGLELDLGNLGKLDLNLAASDQTRSTVQDWVQTVSDKTGFNIFSLFPGWQQKPVQSAAAPQTIMGLDPKVVYIAGGSLALILLIAALKK